MRQIKFVYQLEYAKSNHYHLDEAKEEAAKLEFVFRYRQESISDRQIPKPISGQLHLEFGKIRRGNELRLEHG